MSLFALVRILAFCAGLWHLGTFLRALARGETRSSGVRYRRAEAPSNYWFVQTLSLVNIILCAIIAALPAPPAGAVAPLFFGIFPVLLGLDVAHSLWFGQVGTVRGPILRAERPRAFFEAVLIDGLLVVALVVATLSMLIRGI